MHKSSIIAVCWKSGAKALYIIIPCILGYLGISQTHLEILVGLMVLDIITGFFKTIVVPGKSLKSWVFDWGIAKKMVKLSIPIVIAYMLVAADMNMKWVGSTVMWMFILSEFYSFISNVYCIFTKEDRDEQEAFVFVLKWLLDGTMTTIKYIMDFIEGKITPGKNSSPEQ